MKSCEEKEKWSRRSPDRKKDLDGKACVYACALAPFAWWMGLAQQQVEMGERHPEVERWGRQSMARHSASHQEASQYCPLADPSEWLDQQHSQLQKLHSVVPRLLLLLRQREVARTCRGISFAAATSQPLR